jgi:hypothetical protein
MAGSNSVDSWENSALIPPSCQQILGKAFEGPSTGLPGERLSMEHVGVCRENIDSARYWPTTPSTPHGADGTRRSFSNYGAFALNRTGVWSCGKGRFLPNNPRSLSGNLSCFNDSRSDLVRLGDPSQSPTGTSDNGVKKDRCCVLAIIQRATTHSSATDLTLLLPYTVAALSVSAACPLNPLDTPAHAFAQSTPNRDRVCKYL